MKGLIITVLLCLNIGLLLAADLGQWSPNYNGGKIKSECSAIIAGVGNSDVTYYVGRVLGGANIFPVGIPAGRDGILHRPAYGFGGMIEWTENFDVLCGILQNHPAWMPMNLTSDTINSEVALTAGTISGAPAYVCRALYEDRVLIGYVSSSDINLSCVYITEEDVVIHATVETEVLMTVPST